MGRTPAEEDDESFESYNCIRHIFWIDAEIKIKTIIYGETFFILGLIREKKVYVLVQKGMIHVM